MKQRNNPRITKMFAGFRMGRKKIGDKVKSIPVLPKIKLSKNLFKKFEKAKVLTQAQGHIVEEQLEKCTEKTDPTYVARLLAVLGKVIAKEKPTKEEKINEEENKRN